MGQKVQVGNILLPLFLTTKVRHGQKKVPLDSSSLANAYNTLWQNETSGVLYVAYVINSDNVTHFPDGKAFSRSDMLGHFKLRYSTDGGYTWSAKSWEIPVRPTRIDRENDFKGAVLMHWIVDKGIQDDKGGVWAGFAKIGTYCVNPPTSAWFIHSANLLSASTDAEMEQVTWQTYPEGDDGVHTWTEDSPAISEEPHIVQTPKGFYVVFRTTDGKLGSASSSDGKAWKLGPYATHYGTNAVVKQPRGPITPRRFAVQRDPSGSYSLVIPSPLQTAAADDHMYLMLFYNNGDPSFFSRRVYWLVSGWASANGTNVEWGQPEIGLYTVAHYLPNHNGPGYPDFLLDSTGLLITETDKVDARSHIVDPSTISLLLNQRSLNQTIKDGRILFLNHPARTNITAPKLPDLSDGTTGVAPGFTFDFELEVKGCWFQGQRVLDTRVKGNLGVVIEIMAGSSLRLIAADSEGNNVTITTADDCIEQLASGNHNVAFTVDGGSLVASVVVNGRLCNGKDDTRQGWVTFSRLGNVNNGGLMQIAPDLNGHIGSLSVYNRYLRTSEIISNHRARAAF